MENKDERRTLTGKIIVHGGAGFWKKDLRRGLTGVNSAASAGLDILRRRGSALDAVESAVMVMEDDPVFNAGMGSALTFAGTVEMDASIMDGRDLSSGAVALVRTVRNPVHLARLVMQNTDHVLIAGKNAEKLASVFALPRSNPVTAERWRRWLRMKTGRLPSQIDWIRKNSKLLERHPEILTYDTVGAVAMDSGGDFAAAASTGGMTLKLPGRIGDTPQIGSGLYSDNNCGAATATGMGEVIIRLALSKTVCSMMELGLTAPSAASHAVRTASKRFGQRAGVIAIDRRGRVAAVHNTAFMPWAFSSIGMRRPKTHPHGRIVAP